MLKSSTGAFCAGEHRRCWDRGAAAKGRPPRCAARVVGGEVGVQMIGLRGGLGPRRGDEYGL